MNEPNSFIAPSLLCKLVGHKWSLKIRRDDEPKEGYRLVHHLEKKACVRCGALNPNYGAEPKE